MIFLMVYMANTHFKERIIIIFWRI